MIMAVSFKAEKYYEPKIAKGFCLSFKQRHYFTSLKFLYKLYLLQEIAKNTYSFRVLPPLKNIQFSRGKNQTVVQKANSLYSDNFSFMQRLLIDNPGSDCENYFLPSQKHL